MRPDPRWSTVVALTGAAILAVATSASALGGQGVAVTGPPEDRRIVRAALALVPAQRHRPVVVIDPEATVDPDAIGRLDAFIVLERDGTRRPRIYLNLRSSILREARNGVDFYVKVLAAVIVHEAVHLEGGSEAEARRAESDFFDILVRRGLVTRGDGARHLALLRRRPADVADAGR